MSAFLARTITTMSQFTPMPPPFFASSDDEENEAEDLVENDLLPVKRRSVSRGSAPLASKENQPLFLPDSDDEDEIKPPSSPGAVLDFEDDEDIMVVDAPPAPAPAPTRPIRAPQASQKPSTRTSNPPPAKKRKLSPASSDIEVTTSNDKPFTASYIGSFLVGNAWSTVKGKGYIKQGDPITLALDEPEKPRPLQPTGKGKKGSGGGKQMTLGAAFKAKPTPPKAAGKNKQTVVRLRNTKGFGKIIM